MDGDYERRLQGINWQERFESGFGDFLERMRNEWKDKYNFVFVDSRTGISDIGGICTIHLPDVLVLMSTTSHSGIEGAADVMRRARAAQATLPVDRGRLIGVPVASRDEARTEYKQAKKWQNIFIEALGGFYLDWLPKNKTPQEALQLLRIPYIPYWSFGEPLPVVEERYLRGTDSVSTAYRILANLFKGGLDWSKIFEADSAIPRQAVEGVEHAYDAFISYNSKDYNEAQLVARALIARDLRVAWGREYLQPGVPWLEVLEKTLDSSKAIVVLIGPDGLGLWQRREVESTLDRQAQDREMSVIPVLLPGAIPIPRFLSLNTWVDLSKGVADTPSIDLLAASILGEALPSDQVWQAQTIRELVCPYRGLSEFREEDAEFFFGREAIVDQLTTILGDNRFITIVGPSGSGKSSLVQAGLIPRLRKTRGEDIWDFAFMKPTDKPLKSLATALFPLIEPGKIGLDRLRGIVNLARGLEEGTIDLKDLIDIGRESRAGGSRLLLVVDQWEELYTLCGDRSRAHFTAQLRDAISHGSLLVISTLRHDFAARALDEAELSGMSRHSLFHLRPMHPDELRSVIESPASKVGLYFEAGLVERIIEDLDRNPEDLPLLEFTLTELWKHRQDRVLRHADYDKLGGRQAISSLAEKIFSELGEDDQRAARKLFLQLVQPGVGTQDIKRRVGLSEINEQGRRVMAPFVDGRLLTTALDWEDGAGNEKSGRLDDAQGVVEIAHESLISHWDRLRKWLTEGREFLLWRERLRILRQAWENEGRPEGLLLIGAPLAEAEEWIEKQRRDLTKNEEDFIAHSLDRHYQQLEREAAKRQVESDRRERSRKVTAVSLTAIFLVLLVVALFGLWRWRLSLSHALAAEALGLQDGPLDLALLLGLQAEKTADTLEAKDSLLTVLESSPTLKAFLPGHRGRVSRVAFSPDGQMIASGGARDIFLWDGATGNRIGPALQGHQGAISGLAFNPEGTILASSGADGKIGLWNVADHKLLRPLVPVGEAVRNLVISPAGHLIAASRGTTIYLWDFPGLQPRGEIPQVSWISDLAFDRHGLLAAASADGTITLWDVAQRSRVRVLDAHKTQVLGLAFHPTEDILASVGVDQKVHLWNAATGEELGAPPDWHRDAAVSVAFSRDGQTLASAGRDKVILLWNVASGRWDLTNTRPMRTLVGHGGTVWTLAFGDAGNLVSGGDDEAILWHLQAEPRFSHPIAGLDGEADSVAFNQEGDLLAVGGVNGAIRLWDTVARQPRGSALQGHQGAVNGLIFWKGSLLSGGADGRILIWNLDHLRDRPHEVESPDGKATPGGVWSLALSPSRKILAAGDDRGRVRLWSLDPEKYLGETSEIHQGIVYGLAFNPDGSQLASGGQDSLIRLWDVQSRKRILPPLRGHEDTVSGLAFSPDGQILASSSVDRTVRLWNPRTGRRQRGSPLSGPETSLTGVAFDAKGGTLGASGLDGRIFLWDVGSLHSIGRGVRGVGEAFNLAFDPKGKFLASGNSVSVRLFDLRYETWRSEACRTAGRNITSEEWRKYLGWEPYRETCLENHTGSL
jgi:WD40 repeat protein/energy-coupling factor transporter ATP-binding protein EcfA2